MDKILNDIHNIDECFQTYDKLAYEEYSCNQMYVNSLMQQLVPQNNLEKQIQQESLINLEIQNQDNILYEQYEKIQSQFELEQNSLKLYKFIQGNEKPIQDILYLEDSIIIEYQLRSDEIIFLQYTGNFYNFKITKILDCNGQEIKKEYFNFLLNNKNRNQPLYTINNRSNNFQWYEDKNNILMSIIQFIQNK